MLIARDLLLKVIGATESEFASMSPYKRRKLLSEARHVVEQSLEGARRKSRLHAAVEATADDENGHE